MWSKLSKISRPVLLRDADDVADDRHRQHVGDVVDPVAAARGEQVGRSSRDARARMPSSSLAIARGVKALEMSFRCLLCSGGSMCDDGRIRREQVDGLNERTVDGSERVRVAMQPHGVPVLGGHPEVPLDGLLDARRQARAGTAAGRVAAR